jgi:RNase adaptor protein for sRNA GlmZ degradation
MVRYSDTRRNDPAVREAVIELLNNQDTAVTEAMKLVNQASVLMRQAADGHIDASEMRLYKDAADAISTAFYQLNRVDRFRGGGDNETYVGNIAASPVGEAIERRMNR